MKLTSMDVSGAAIANLHCAQTSVAHVHGIVMREDIGSTMAFHLLVSRDYGESVWESVVHAGREFQLCPFGVTALELLHN
jgi:sarcosine oxidase, subunit alpha